MKLSGARPGHTLQILYFPPGTASLQARRLGLFSGSRLFCAFVLSGGPVVVQFRRQMIAVGRSLAKQIVVEVIR